MDNGDRNGEDWVEDSSAVPNVIPGVNVPNSQYGITNLLALEAYTMQNWLMNEPATDIPAYIEDSEGSERVRFILRRDQTVSNPDSRFLLLFCNYANDQNITPHITSVHFPNHTISNVEKIQDYMLGVYNIQNNGHTISYDPSNLFNQSTDVYASACFLTLNP